MEAKLCPVCGRDSMVFGGLRYVRCSNVWCLQGPVGLTTEEAIVSWNAIRFGEESRIRVRGGIEKTDVKWKAERLGNMVYDTPIRITEPPQDDDTITIG